MSAGCTKGINLSFFPYKGFKYPKLLTNDTFCKKTFVGWGLGGKISRVKKKKESIYSGANWVYMFVSMLYVGGVCLWFVLSASHCLLPKAASFKSFWNHEPLHFFQENRKQLHFEFIWTVECCLLTFEDPLGHTQI